MMRTIAMLDLVRRLLAHEAAESQDQDSLIEAAERVSEELRVHLSKRIGQEGFRTILARSLALTTAKFPHLSAVRVGADGTLIGLRGAISHAQEAQDKEAQDKEAQDKMAQDNKAQGVTIEGAVALVAQLLALLISFIGEDLTLRLLSAVQPEFAWDDVTGRENEKQ